MEDVENNLRFPGQYFDAETGLHYNFHRYDDSEIGRYIKVDPIGFDGGDVNVYAYVWNNSIGAHDTKGLRKGEAVIFHRKSNPGWACHVGYDIGFSKIF